MKLLETSVYLGPNVYALFPVIRFTLDLQELEQWPTMKLGAGFVEALVAALPLILPPVLWVLPAVAVGGALVVAMRAGTGEFSQPNGTLKVSLLQGNVPQDEKFSLAHLPEALAWTREQLLAAQGELVLGPETVIPLLPAQLDPAYWESLLAHFRGGRFREGLIHAVGEVGAVLRRLAQ